MQGFTYEERGNLDCVDFIERHTLKQPRVYARDFNDDLLDAWEESDRAAEAYARNHPEVKPAS